jgi:hypothetical protein
MSDPGQHKCLIEADKKLAEKNTRLSWMFGVSSTNMGSFIRVATEKVDKSIRGKPLNIVANYCPFCGKKL